MSDKKHIEYCIRLGNTWTQNKLQQINEGTYVEPQVNQEKMLNEGKNSFKYRLQNWNN